MDQEISDKLAQRFEKFALECQASSPLYAHLSKSVALDADILEFASYARPGQPAPNMLFGAVHYLLLTGLDDPVASYFASLSAKPAHPENAYPYFREFCFKHKDKVIALISTRLVQTNEVGRCAGLLPALSLVSKAAGGAPLYLIELGCSAGLNLCFDQYKYIYGDGSAFGNLESSVQIKSELKGINIPPLPFEFPTIANRVGIDINPINIFDDDEILWLRALIWPEHHQRVETLKQAIDVARSIKLQLIKKDAVVALPEILKLVPDDNVPCIYHTMVMNQIPVESKDQMYAFLAEFGRQRRVYEVAIYFPQLSGAVLELNTYGHGENMLEVNTYSADGYVKRQLANCHPHGKWIEWLAPDIFRENAISGRQGHS